MNATAQKTISSSSPTGKRGVAVVEFLFAAPAFFVMVFFVIEIALTWNDRHIMRLAAYRAAKAVVKTRALTGSTTNLCWSTPTAGGAQSPSDERIRTAARRASAKIMATVTPSATQLLTMFGTPGGASRHIDDALEAMANSEFGDAVSTITNNPYVHAVVRMVKGLPAAWLFTDLSCTNIEFPQTAGTTKTPGVEVTLTYHRPAKMPYVGTIIWVLHWLQHFNADDDGTTGALRIDPLTYGITSHIDLNDPQIGGILNTIHQRAKDIIVDTANELKTRLDTGVISKSVIIFDYLPESFAPTTTPSIFGKISGTAFDQVISETQNWRTQQLPNLQGTVNFIADNAINLMISAPSELKTIPIRVSVRIPNYNQAYVNKGHTWDDNSAYLLGSFTGPDKVARLAKALGKTLNESDPPNESGKDMPYQTNADDDTDPR